MSDANARYWVSTFAGRNETSSKTVQHHAKRPSDYSLRSMSFPESILQSGSSSELLSSQSPVETEMGFWCTAVRGGTGFETEPMHVCVRSRRADEIRPRQNAAMGQIRYKSQDRCTVRFSTGTPQGLGQWNRPRLRLRIGRLRDPSRGRQIRGPERTS